MDFISIDQLPRPLENHHVSFNGSSYVHRQGEKLQDI